MTTLVTRLAFAILQAKEIASRSGLRRIAGKIHDLRAIGAERARYRVVGLFDACAVDENALHQGRILDRDTCNCRRSNKKCRCCNSRSE